MIVRMTDPVAPIRRRKPSWAKGLTAADHPGIARQAAARRGKKRGPYRSYGLWQKDPSRVDPHTLLKPTQFTDYAYLFGLYLGDGSITRVNRSRSRWTRGSPRSLSHASRPCKAFIRGIVPRFVGRRIPIARSLVLTLGSGSCCSRSTAPARSIFARSDWRIGSTRSSKGTTCSFCAVWSNRTGRDSRVGSTAPTTRLTPSQTSPRTFARSFAGLRT